MKSIIRRSRNELVIATSVAICRHRLKSALLFRDVLIILVPAGGRSGDNLLDEDFFVSQLAPDSSTA
jgi:hypothetical protein